MGAARYKLPAYEYGSVYLPPRLNRPTNPFVNGVEELCLIRHIPRWRTHLPLDPFLEPILLHPVFYFLPHDCHSLEDGLYLILFCPS